MISQESILILIQKESWEPILEILYKHKQDIPNDPLLKYSANIFETEFFQKLSEDSTSITTEHLQQLYLLHSGNFFILKDQNYKHTVCALAKRSEGRTAYSYAQLFPQEEVCKEIIKNNAVDEMNETVQNIIPTMNWIEIYNRLFELINVQGDTRTYFSGPRYINTLRELSPYHPDYQQYIDLRNKEGKSTSRKIFYYDIIMKLDEPSRIKFINKILGMVEPFEKEKVTPIKALINGELTTAEPLKEDIPNTVNSEGVATVFISYSWDSEEHKKWVLDLANQLRNERVNVILDRYELKAGKSLPHFVESSIKNANRILIVFTPNYKLKAEKRTGGVGYEYSIMNSELYKDQTNNERIIPVLRAGSSTESIPEFMQQYIHIDMRNDENFQNSYTDLLREIYDEPEIVKPPLGEKRTF